MSPNAGTMFTWFRDTAARYPDEVALEVEHQSVRYGELLDMAERLATRLVDALGALSPVLGDERPQRVEHGGAHTRAPEDLAELGRGGACAAVAAPRRGGVPFHGARTADLVTAAGLKEATNVCAQAPRASHRSREEQTECLTGISRQIQEGI